MDPEILSRLDQIIALLKGGAAAPPGSAAPSPLRNAYTCEEFAAEVLDGKRSAKWVRQQIRSRRIKSTSRRPYTIPQSEALRFMKPPDK